MRILPFFFNLVVGIFFSAAGVLAQQLPAELIRPGQQSDLEIINEKEALKKWREADALYLKNAKTNDRTKALQLWEEIAQIPPSETSPFLNQLIINSALNTGRFDAARKALMPIVS